MRLICAAVIVFLAGCQSYQDSICTLEARPAIRVLTFDSTSNTPVVSSSAEIIASLTNSYADTVRATPYNGAFHAALAVERAGSFRLDVVVVGYAPWTATGIRVEHDGCHVETVDITANLQPRFTAPAVVRDTVPRIQTSELSYKWRRNSDFGWEVDIPITYRNSTSDTIYMVNCNTIPQVSLEKQYDNAWRPIMTGVAYPACLSNPVVFPPGVLVRDTFTFFGADPGRNAFPQFVTTDIDGVYRLAWHKLVFHYRDGGGDPVPLVQQLSNSFVMSR